jgi:hypothetical protein
MPTSCEAQSQRNPTSQQERSLKRFLQDYAGAPGAVVDRKTVYFSSFVDLKDDGTQNAIVYLAGNSWWCGSGGCTTLILAPRGSSYRIVTRITITRPPIEVLATKSNGWHDIAVQVQGGGIMRAYQAKLSFNGRTHPSNPSIFPAKRLENKPAGKGVISITSGGTPLY